MGDFGGSNNFGGAFNSLGFGGQKPFGGVGGVVEDTALVVKETNDAGAAISYNEAATGNRLFEAGLSTPSAYSTIFIKNNGDGILDLGTPTLGGVGAAEYELDLTGFDTTVAAGGSTTLKVRFAPSVEANNVQATISFTHDDADETSPFIINLEGDVDLFLDYTETSVQSEDFEDWDTDFDALTETSVQSEDFEGTWP